MEGTAFEAEYIRQAAQAILGGDIDFIFTSGGGTRIPGWMQIKADISGCTIAVPNIKEAALLGAAEIAGIGIGLYADPQSSVSRVRETSQSVYHPDGSHTRQYERIYQNGFLPLQIPLREVYRDITPD